MLQSNQSRNASQLARNTAHPARTELQTSPKAYQSYRARRSSTSSSTSQQTTAVMEMTRKGPGIATNLPTHEGLCATALVLDDGPHERGSAGSPARKAKDETFCRLDARAIKKTLQVASSGRSRDALWNVPCEYSPFSAKLV